MTIKMGESKFFTIKRCSGADWALVVMTLHCPVPTRPQPPEAAWRSRGCAERLEKRRYLGCEFNLVLGFSFSLMAPVVFETQTNLWISFKPPVCHTR